MEKGSKTMNNYRSQKELRCCGNCYYYFNDTGEDTCTCKTYHQPSYDLEVTGICDYFKVDKEE